MQLAPQVFLYPAHSFPPPHSANRLVLAEIPSTAFGNGSHPTTRLCAGAVDFICRQSAPRSVLDVGTGTGILARIARARGAALVAGTDIDPDALSAAHANAELDAHAIQIPFLNVSPVHWGARFDLVIANILEGPLRELGPSLAAALAPGGTLLLSGFTRIQIGGLRLIYENYGLRFVNQSQLDDWSLLMFRRN